MLPVLQSLVLFIPTIYLFAFNNSLELDFRLVGWGGLSFYQLGKMIILVYE